MERLSSQSTSKKALESLVNRLAEARRSHKITQAQLAKLLGKRHQSAIAKIEGHEHKLELHDFVKWARIVGECPIDLLQAFEDDLERPKRTRVHLEKPEP